MFEDAEADEIDALAPEQVAQPACQQRRRTRMQSGRSDDPREARLGEARAVLLDRRNATFTIVCRRTIRRKPVHRIVSESQREVFSYRFRRTEKSQKARLVPRQSEV